ncbi:uncharacterized protein L203_106436 [Cryptococcus depauperatus CBS 7841]|uniref:Uncharacterized protein n=1 Tax=Cryptococcus depauperatus CBS 7841 TaxID=1295531 RepID=A0A1E3IIX8_9TREE|nr:hypothetical protein L203_02561 [Cryptococcus depauperatus CBS 7841]
MFNKNGGATRTRPASSRRKRIILSYAPDWVLTILLWGLFYLLDKINGYRRVFDINDTSLAHPSVDHERVPVWLAGVVCGAVPAVIIIAIACIRKSFWDAHNGILGLVLALGLTVTFTDIIKITAGRPRPDLFDWCKLPTNLTQNPPHSLTSWRECTTTDDKTLRESFRSFPSGHSSFAWCGMWYLILWLAAKMRINNRKGFTWKSWLLLVPLSSSTLISLSRTMDYRHHATDVIAGGIIGVLAAWWCYRQYYPPLSHTQPHQPYSPRIPKEESLIPLHNRPSHRLSSEAMLNHHGPVDFAAAAYAPKPQNPSVLPPNVQDGFTGYNNEFRPRDVQYGDMGGNGINGVSTDWNGVVRHGESMDDRELAPREVNPTGKMNLKHTGT